MSIEDLVGAKDNGKGSSVQVLLNMMEGVDSLGPRRLRCQTYYTK
jgi:hypothetical protein